jgi:hypothetical protein
MSDTVEEPGEEEVDPYDQEILDLGPPPGPGDGADISDEYYGKLNEIEGRRVDAQLEEQEEARRNATADAEVDEGDGTGRAAGT